MDYTQYINKLKNFFKDIKNIAIFSLSVALSILFFYTFVHTVAYDFNTKNIQNQLSIDANRLYNELEKTKKELLAEKNTDKSKQIKTLQDSNKLLLDEKTQLESNKNELEKEKEILENDKANIQKQVETLEQDKTNLQNQIGTLEQDKTDLQNQIEELKKTSSTKSTTSNASTSSITSTSKNQAASSTSSTSSQASTSYASSNSNSEMVWVGQTGNKYHYQGCRTLKGNGHQITLSQALSEGREACKVCH